MDRLSVGASELAAVACKGAALDDLNVYDEVCREVCSAAEYNFCRRFFSFTAKDATVVLDDFWRIASRDVEKLLNGCVQLALIVCTLGRGVDALIKRYLLIDSERAYLADVAASLLIEKYVEAEHKKIISECGDATDRFSCGYGDWALSGQQTVLDALNATKLVGVGLTSGGMLSPIKSVTALIGIGKNNKIEDGCATCPQASVCKGGICER